MCLAVLRNQPDLLLRITLQETLGHLGHLFFAITQGFFNPLINALQLVTIVTSFFDVTEDEDVGSRGTTGRCDEFPDSL